MRELFSIKTTYLDSAATTLRPNFLLEKELEFARDHYATVHRSLYPRALVATEGYYLARRAVQERLHATTERGIIFTKGATDSLNQVAQFMTQLIGSEDEIWISPIEHHANYLPFLALQQKGQLKVRFLPIHPDGALDFAVLETMDTTHLKALSIAHVSNVTGVEQDLVRLGKWCRQRNCLFIVDAAQSIAHTFIDVEAAHIDFLAFSTHKMYGPTGLGVLCIAEHLLERLEPIYFGGDMIRDLSQDMIFQDPPLKFEAGTPPICQVIALKETLEWQKGDSFKEARAHLPSICQIYQEQLGKMPGVRLISSPNATSIITMTFADLHPMDLALILGNEGIEVRSGSLCSIPALRYFEANAFLRLSLGIHNTAEEVSFVLSAFSRVHSKLR